MKLTESECTGWTKQDIVRSAVQIWNCSFAQGALMSFIWSGVCTDICVLHTAVDAYNKGYRIHVHADAVASFNPEGHTWALQHFTETMGVQLWSGGSKLE